MNAVDQRLALLFQRLGGRNVGLDHHLFDQLVRIETFRNMHAVDRAVFPENDLAFRHVELKRLAPVAPALHHLIGMPQGFKDRLQQRAGLLVRLAVDRRLRLLVGELGRTLHHDAVEGVACLAPLMREDHAHGKRRPVDALAQRAEIIRDPFGQHRHDAVREIDGVAALQRLAIQRRFRPDVIGDVGDCHRHDHAIGIVGRSIQLGKDGVVMVLGIMRVDGDQRQVAPVFPMRHGRRLGVLGL